MDDSDVDKITLDIALKLISSLYSNITECSPIYKNDTCQTKGFCFWMLVHNIIEWIIIFFLFYVSARYPLEIVFDVIEHFGTTLLTIFSVTLFFYIYYFVQMILTSNLTEGDFCYP